MPDWYIFTIKNRALITGDNTSKNEKKFFGHYDRKFSENFKNILVFTEFQLLLS